MEPAAPTSHPLIEHPAPPCCLAATRMKFRFCPNCGSLLTSDAQSPVTENSLILETKENRLTEPNATGSKVRQLLDNRIVIAGLLLCGGPVALPALWFSRRFSPTTKTLITVGYTLLTVVMPIAVTWYFMNAALWPLVEAFQR